MTEAAAWRIPARWFRSARGIKTREVFIFYLPFLISIINVFRRRQARPVAKAPETAWLRRVSPDTSIPSGEASG